MDQSEGKKKKKTDIDEGVGSKEKDHLGQTKNTRNYKVTDAHANVEPATFITNEEEKVDRHDLVKELDDQCTREEGHRRKSHEWDEHAAHKEERHNDLEQDDEAHKVRIVDRHKTVRAAHIKAADTRDVSCSKKRKTTKRQLSL